MASTRPRAARPAPVPAAAATPPPAAPLAGQTVIVTGGAKGYGAGIAAVLAEAGAQVWITGRDRAALNATAKAQGVNAVVADVTVPKDWDRLFKQVLRATGRLDVLVNNAGAGIAIGPLAQASDDDLARCIAVNLTGQLFGCRRAATVMTRQRSGLIINISSLCDRYAWPGWSAYSAAKAGLKQASHCLYAELRSAGVRVTTISPSWGATEFVAAAHLAGHPAGDPAVRAQCIQPRELGEWVRHLCLTPAHLVLPDVSIQPLVQEIVPL